MLGRLALALPLALAAPGLVACGSSSAPAASTSTQGVPPVKPGSPALDYPQTRRGDVVDVYHGVEIPDPYRWLEDPDSDETRAWVEAQNAVTFRYLSSLPGRARLKQRLTELWNYERYGTPTKMGGRYFYSKNDGLQNQAVLYWAPSLSEEPRVLLDPNQLSEDGTVALAGYSVSEDGRYLAYGLQEAGSDWTEWKVREVETAEDTSDHLKWVKFSGASWTHDGKGFFYSRYPEPVEGSDLTEANTHQKLYYHRLGTPQSADELVYERPDQPKWGFGGQVTEDGRYLVISVWKGTGPKNLLFYKDLKQKNARVVELIDEFEAEYRFLGNRGSVFWFFTDLEAPRGRIVSYDLRRPGAGFREELGQREGAALQSASLVGGKLFTEYLVDATSQVEVHELDEQKMTQLELPGIGSVSGFGGRMDDTETFYSYTSFTAPTTVYRYDIEQGTSEVVWQPTVSFDPDDYVVEQVFYESKDGTRVPMFLTHKKGLEKNGANPTLLYGYGGFSVSLTPSFSISRAVWLELGGVLAVANLRGGGEYGEEWHVAGTKLQKQNVFDDFIAAAEHLIASGWTSKEKLAIQGGSNGGLLVGAAITQRPDLFAVALPAVGVLDMLRFHTFTIGWAWVDDYGSSEDPEEFEVLRAYSPLHNLRPGTSYPATLVTTADHDDRVVPAHSYKFAAELQRVHAGDTPVLIRIDTRAGHGGGKPTEMLIDEVVDVWSFVAANLGMSLE